MEIVCDNYKEKETKDTTCVHCGSVLRYAESDIVHLDNGCSMPSVKCPCCGSYFEVDDFSPRKVEEVRFPGSFYYFSADNGAVDIDNECIENWIREGIKALRNSPDDYTYITGSGDTRVYIVRLGGDESYNIAVAKNYYEFVLPFEQIDYDLNNDDDTRFEYCFFDE